MNPKEAFPFQESMAEIAEKAVVLTARAVGNGLARMIERYVPAPLMGSFAAHLAEELLREVHIPVDGTSRVTLRDNAN